MRGGDLQALLADRRGDVVQQARAVAPVHLDDGVGVPSGLAIIVMLAGLLVFFAAFFFVVYASLQQLVERLPAYQAMLALRLWRRSKASWFPLARRLTPSCRATLPMCRRNWTRCWRR